MPIETRSNSALFRRAEQLKRWEDSETNNVPATIPKDKNVKIKFSDGCVFLAACAASDTEEVERLINLGTDINTANVDGLTALHQACIDNNLDMVQFLVEHECDVNRGDNEGWTPLHATASCGFISIAKYLIEHGGNVAAVNNDGDLPIDIAGSTEMETYLSDVLDEKDIDCDEARSEEERIMLHDAKLIASSSVDVNNKIHPRTCATPLHVAAAKGYIDVMKILIQAEVDLNAQDSDGWTSLHAASHWCQKEACAILADNLANMGIQNFAGQTCFDVADPDIVKLLEELKKKQASMQKDNPEIQAILQRTSNRPPLKRRTSVTRMSGQEKSKSVMKDTKAERAQIENLTLPEEDNEEEKGKPPKAVLNSETVQQPEVKKEPGITKTPSWKKFLLHSAEESNKEDDVSKKDGRPTIPPLRDDESELQRKAHAKRVRETRRSTQGVLLEDIKSAELQYLINTQQEAAKRQVEESLAESKPEAIKSQDTSDIPDGSITRSSKGPDGDSKETIDSHSSGVEKPASEPSSKSDVGSRVSCDSSRGDIASSVTLPLRPKSTSSPEDKSPSENRTSLGTQAAIQRRRRPKRRTTGVVYLDSDDENEDKKAGEKDSNTTEEPGHVDRPRQRYGSSTSIPDSASDTSSRSDVLSYGSRVSLNDDANKDYEKLYEDVKKRNQDASPRSDALSPYSSRVSLNEDANKEYKKLYEDAKKENERLKETLMNTEEELEKVKKQLQKLTQSNAIKNSVSDTEKKEKRGLERKLSEMEEEIKQNEKLKADNERLKEENAALIRVISKISQ